MKKSIIEWTKNILLIALTCSAVYLTIVANRYYNLELPFVGSLSIEETAAPTTGNTVSEASRPVKMAVMNAYGRYVAAYNSDEVDQMYDRLGRYLGEALGTIADTEQVEQETVIEKLSAQGVFFEFPGRVNLSALAAWLGAGVPSGAEDPAADMFVIAMEESGETLCYRTENGWFCSNIQLREDAAVDMEVYRPNNVSFAYELAAAGSSFENIESFCLIDPQPVPVQVASASVTAELRETVASYLGFNPYSDSSYIEDNGDEVFTANNSMLRLEAAGLLTYNAPGGGTGSKSAAERIELARLNLAELVRPGDAELYFVGETYEDGLYVLDFDYYIGGVKVTNSNGSGARVVIDGGDITKISVWLRSYTATGEASTLLPAVQAAAMAEGELEVVYTDNGTDMLAVGWQAE